MDGQIDQCEYSGKVLCIQRKYTMIFNGDNVRMRLNYDLGFIECDRIKNVRRSA